MESLESPGCCSVITRVGESLTQSHSNMVRTLTTTPDSPGIQPLTLQLLVPSLPLKADGCCSLVDEALEAGILALLYRAAGWLNGDDRASEACTVRY